MSDLPQLPQGRLQVDVSGVACISFVLLMIQIVLIANGCSLDKKLEKIEKAIRESAKQDRGEE